MITYWFLSEVALLLEILAFVVGLGTKWFQEWSFKIFTDKFKLQSRIPLILAAILPLAIPLGLVLLLTLAKPSHSRLIALCWLIGGAVGALVHDVRKAKKHEES